ncbi:MAG: hypothetical protein ACI8PZ_003163 [Myxococcota bacterium]|jgi:hypothetical protein
MNRYLVFFVPFVSIVTVGVGGRIWLDLNAGIPRGEVVDTELAELDLAEPFVRVSGMAHYPVVIKQTVPGTLITADQTVWLWPLFEPHDTSSRGIRILVRAARPPESLVSFEYMTLEGHLSPVTPEKVPFSTEIELGKRTEYWFTDDMLLLEAWRIESDGEVWELPAD